MTNNPQRKWTPAKDGPKQRAWIRARMPHVGVMMDQAERAREETERQRKEFEHD